GPLNDAYEARFGFRYVIFVAGRSRSAIVPLLEQALAAEREAERHRGLTDVVAIARARAATLGMHTAGEKGP
ncbi:MAG: 2-oxo-4-hydroxy-4-carboxy-5-ureidoimidazoline decarboxylase, partial [Chloroflexi bacterium]|nr:2-oxo-4-hydroxy-4-carboxy-5-ureidoimidazoline decarboxylase [Chloroflexota bacterium]